MSLRTRLLVSHTIVAVVAIVIVAVVASLAVNRYFRNLAQVQAHRDAQPFVQPLEQCYRIFDGWPTSPGACMIREGRAGRLEPPMNRRLLVANTQGTIIFDTHLNRGVGHALPPEARAWALPLRVDGAEIGFVVARPNTGVLGEAEDQFILLVRRSMIIASVGGVLLALVSGFILATSLTRPLRALTGAAYRLAHGDRSARVPDSRATDEVGELSRAFNSMSASLEQAEATRRQMVADIAHELRTPLSVLQLELESIEDGVVEPTPQVLASLTQEVGLLNRLIGDLRTLSLADAGQLQLQLEPLEVGAFMQRLVPRYQSAAREKQIDFVVQPGGLLPSVAADEDRLAQVLNNLIHNALHYTPAQGRVRLQVEHVHNELVWTIEDTGPGFASHEAEAIFERFYRADKARTRESGGSGLGLAIARGLIEAMGGRVWAQSVPNQGATFLVALPVLAS